MRILYVLSDPTWRFVRSGGGYLRHVEEVVGALRTAGHTVDVLDTRRRRGGEADAGAASTAPPRAGFSPQSLLPRKLRALGRDLTYLANNRRVAPLVEARLAGGDVDLIYERFHHMQWAGVEAAKRHGIPLVLEYNAGQHEIVDYQEPGLVAVGRRTERRILTSADRVITVSEVLRQHVIEQGVAPDRVITQHNGVDVEHFHPDADAGAVRRDLGIDDDAVVVGFVGSFTAWQGIDLLVAAVSALADHQPAIRCVVVGGVPGSARFEEVRRSVDAHGVEDRVHLVGRVPEQAVRTYLAAIDIAAMPWTAEYTSPIKLFEYMAMGRAIVAADQPAVREVLDDGVDAVLVRRDAQELSRAISELARDADKRRVVGAAARRRALERHTWDRHARLIESIYAEIRGSGSPAAEPV